MADTDKLSEALTHLREGRVNEADAALAAFIASEHTADVAAGRAPAPAPVKRSRQDIWLAIAREVTQVLGSPAALVALLAELDEAE